MYLPKGSEAISESSTSEDVRLVHDTILALDAHLDIEMTFFTPEQGEASMFQKLASLEKIEAGGLGAAFFVAYTDQGPLMFPRESGLGVKRDLVCGRTARKPDVCGRRKFGYRP
jgi:hypothetical protein